MKQDHVTSEDLRSPPILSRKQTAGPAQHPPSTEDKFRGGPLHQSDFDLGGHGTTPCRPEERVLLADGPLTLVKVIIQYMIA